MKAFLSLAALLPLALAGAGDLFISEYVEGTSYTKAIELHNPSGASVSMDGVKLQWHHNGQVYDASMNYDLDLSGHSIGAHGTFVICRTPPSNGHTLIGAAKCDMQVSYSSEASHAVLHTGDDAVELLVGGSRVDVIGTVGSDPGSCWKDASGKCMTKDKTLRRKASVASGSATWNSAQWAIADANDDSNLGLHTVNTCPASANCFTGATGQTWRGSASYWSKLAYPVYPQQVRVFDGRDVLVQSASTAFPDGVAQRVRVANGASITVKAEGSLVLGPSACDATQTQSTAPTGAADRTCSDNVVCTNEQWEQSPRTATQDRVCLPLTTCEDGQYETAAPTQFSDRTCESHSPCDYANQYESKAPGPSSDRECTALTTCDDVVSGAGTQYESTAKTNTSNRVCSPISDCANSGVVSTWTQYQTAAPTTTSDRQCAPLTTCDDVVAGSGTQYEKTTPTATTNRVCEAVSDCANSGAVSTWTQYQTAAPTWNTDRQCAPLTTCDDVVAGSGTQYEKTAPTATTNRVCAAIDDCANSGDISTWTQYQTAAPTWNTNRACATLRVCTNDEWEDATPTKVTNRGCAPVTTCDYTTQYQTKAPTADSDRLCAALLTCTNNEYQSKAPTQTTNRECDDIKSCANSGAISTWTQYQTAAPVWDASGPNGGHYTADRQCAALTTCDDVVAGSGTQWESKAPTTTTNRVCSPIRDCANSGDISTWTQYQTAAPTWNSNRKCHTLTTCEGDEYETAMPTQLTDRDCQAHKKCSSTQYMSQAPTGTTDRHCTAIQSCDFPASEYQTAEPTWDASGPDGGHYTSDRQCADLRFCGTDEYQSQAPTSTTNRVCLPLTTCDNNGSGATQYELTAPTWAKTTAVPSGQYTTNRVCAALLTCDDVVAGAGTEFESTAPTTNTNRQCSAIKSCHGLEFQSAAPTATTDRVCEAHTTCTDTQYQTKAAETHADRECAAHTTCKATEYQYAAPTETTDRQCKTTPICIKGYYLDKTNQLWECQPCHNGEYQDEVGKDTCKPCAPGHFTPEISSYWGQGTRIWARQGYESCDPCATAEWQGASKQPSCNICDMTCDAGSFHTTCGGTAPGQCELCDKGYWSAAGSGKGVSTACSPCDYGTVSDAKGTVTCTPCNGTTEYMDQQGQQTCKQVYECTGTEYETKAPTATSNRVCSSHTTCDYAAQWESKEEGTHEDRECTPLTTCDYNKQYRSVDKTNTSDRSCAPLTFCNYDTQYESKAKTATSNRECTSLTNCGAGYYQSVAKTFTDDRQCALCPDGEFKSAANNDAFCTPCPSGMSSRPDRVQCRARACSHVFCKHEMHTCHFGRLARYRGGADFLNFQPDECDGRSFQSIRVYHDKIETNCREGHRCGMGIVSGDHSKCECEPAPGLTDTTNAVRTIESQAIRGTHWRGGRTGTRNHSIRQVTNNGEGQVQALDLKAVTKVCLSKGDTSTFTVKYRSTDGKPTSALGFNLKFDPKMFTLKSVQTSANTGCAMSGLAGATAIVSSSSFSAVPYSCASSSGQKIIPASDDNALRVVLEAKGGHGVTTVQVVANPSVEAPGYSYSVANAIQLRAGHCPKASDTTAAQKQAAANHLAGLDGSIGAAAP